VKSDRRRSEKKSFFLKQYRTSLLSFFFEYDWWLMIDDWWLMIDDLNLRFISVYNLRVIHLCCFWKSEKNKNYKYLSNCNRNLVFLQTSNIMNNKSKKILFILHSTSHLFLQKSSFISSLFYHLEIIPLSLEYFFS
jgi:hypothetical protein